MLSFCSPQALRNLHAAILFTEPPLAFLVLAVVPMSQVLGTANILALLASLSSSNWLKILVIIDAVIVLGGE